MDIKCFSSVFKCFTANTIMVIRPATPRRPTPNSSKSKVAIIFKAIERVNKPSTSKKKKPSNDPEWLKEYVEKFEEGVEDL